MYSREHLSCNEPNCKILSSYVRIDKKYTKIGYFTTGCKKFAQSDPETEKEMQEAVRTMRHSKYSHRKSIFTIYLQDLLS